MTRVRRLRYVSVLICWKRGLSIHDPKVETAQMFRDLKQEEAVQLEPVELALASDGLD